jgi:hypothetical protein
MRNIIDQILFMRRLIFYEEVVATPHGAITIWYTLGICDLIILRQTVSIATGFSDRLDRSPGDHRWWQPGVTTKEHTQWLHAAQVCLYVSFISPSSHSLTPHSIYFIGIPILGLRDTGREKMCKTVPQAKIIANLLLTWMVQRSGYFIRLSNSQSTTYKQRQTLPEGK